MNLIHTNTREVFLRQLSTIYSLGFFLQQHSLSLRTLADHWSHQKHSCKCILVISILSQKALLVSYSATNNKLNPCLALGSLSPPDQLNSAFAVPVIVGSSAVSRLPFNSTNSTNKNSNDDCRPALHAGLNCFNASKQAVVVAWTNTSTSLHFHQTH